MRLPPNSRYHAPVACIFQLLESCFGISYENIGQVLLDPAQAGYTLPCQGPLLQNACLDFVALHYRDLFTRTPYGEAVA